MDNITHSLFGAVLGRALMTKRDSLSLQKAVLWTAIIGSNISDLDILFRTTAQDPHLGYLLLHRGYTHSVWAALPLGWVSARIGARVSRISLSQNPRLLILGCLSVLFHILADFGNNYGVHPFSPWNQRWYYGDTIFILEPLLFAVLVPSVFFCSVTKGGKIASAVIGLLVTCLLFFEARLPWTFIGFFLGISGGFILIQKKYRSASIAFLGTLGVVAAFTWASREAKVKIREAVQSHVLKESKIHTIAASPSPANLLCWSFVTLSEEGSDYVARQGILSLMPDWVKPENCYHPEPSRHLTSTQIEKQWLEHDMKWWGEYRKPISEFRNLRNQYCNFELFLRFSRIPIWYLEGQNLFSEDLRYDIGGARSFTRTQLNAGDQCPDFPKWEKPTHPLLPLEDHL